ncbi:MAG: DNA adenine methylase, partial [Candidatus Dormibacteraceae bacterium]
ASTGRIQRAVLSDINPELVISYQVVRNNVRELIPLLQKVKRNFDESERKQYYYRIKGIDPATLSVVQRAARFIFLMKTCFNGLCRLNKLGGFNTPFGRITNPNICDQETLLAASEALQLADIRCEDFGAALSAAEVGDFVYCDPPYEPVSETADFTEYAGKRFDESEQRRLRDWLLHLRWRGVAVLASNSSAPLIDELYQGFRVETVRARRAVNSNGSGRGKVDEAIISFGPA